MRNGDRNTAYFHRKASNRRKKNGILPIKDELGNWKYEDEEILAVLEEYFETIFQSTLPSDESLVAANCNI